MIEVSCKAYRDRLMQIMFDKGYKVDYDDGSPEEGNRAGLPTLTIRWS